MFFGRIVTLVFFVLACFAVLMPTTVDSGMVTSPACVAACQTAFAACVAATAGLGIPVCTAALTVCMAACVTTVLVPV